MTPLDFLRDAIALQNQVAFSADEITGLPSRVSPQILAGFDDALGPVTTCSVRIQFDLPTVSLFNVLTSANSTFQQLHCTLAWAIRMEFIVCSVFPLIRESSPPGLRVEIASIGAPSWLPNS